MEDIAKYISLMLVKYGFNASRRYYPAGSMDEVILRAIEGVKIGNEGYIYIPGRDGQEYVSGGDPTLAIRWNRDRPNISYLIAGYPEMISDFFNTMMTIDRGGGYTLEDWVVPAEEGGSIQLDHITYNEPIDGNMFIGAMIKEGDTAVPTIGEVAASILGSYMLINHKAPDRDMRYRHMIASMPNVIIGSTGQWKVPYYNLFLSLKEEG